MAIKPTNTISCLTRGQYYTNNEFEKSGIYILSCHTCGWPYIRAHGMRFEHTIHRELLIY